MDMFYVVGLGNPGDKYEGTRHNAGFMVLDYMVEQCGFPGSVQSSKYAGRISEGMIGEHEVTLLWPETFMNKSGSAVKKLVPKGQEENLIVIYDDVDLPVGEIKVSKGRGAGGHNGISSIISSLGSKDFVRVRVGIASKNIFGQTKRPKGHRLGNHVMGEFKRREEGKLEDVFPEAFDAIEITIQKGVEIAMNHYN